MNPLAPMVLMALQKVSGPNPTAQIVQKVHSASMDSYKESAFLVTIVKKTALTLSKTSVPKADIAKMVWKICVQMVLFQISKELQKKKIVLFVHQVTTVFLGLKIFVKLDTCVSETQQSLIRVMESQGRSAVLDIAAQILF